LQDFLMATAVPERINRELAAAISGREDAGQFLAEVRRRRLFLQPLGGPGEWYRYHALFRRFLLRRLHARGREARQDLQPRAGAAWRAGGEPTEAVPHLLAAGDPEAALDALEPVAERLATSPEAPKLAVWLAQIPRERWAARPGVVLAEGTLALGVGDFVRAANALEQAVFALADAGEEDRAAVGCFLLIHALGFTNSGQEDRAIGSTGMALDRLNPRNPMVAAARVLRGGMLAFTGNYHSTEVELNRALSAFAQVPSWLNAYAVCIRAFWLDFPQGRLDAASEAMEKVLPTLESAPDEDPLAVAWVGCVWLAWILGELGRTDRALAQLDRAEANARARGTGYYAGEWRLNLLADAGRWGQLEAELRRPAGPPGPEAHVGAVGRA